MSRMRVLLVDDEADFRALLLKRMTHRGVDAMAVGDGEAALAAVAEGHFDVVVLDVRMPGMDGIEVLRRLKRDHPDVEVVLLTGHASIEAARTGMDLGAFDYCIKPVSINDLLVTLQEAVARRRLAAGAE